MNLLSQIGILELSYVVASVTFILGLKMLSNPKTARKGNLIAAFGMGLAILTTILFHRDPDTGEHIKNIGWIIGALLIGTVGGAWVSRIVKMTAMPQMVSFFNGMGGATAALIGMIEFNKLALHGVEGSLLNGHVLVMVLGVFIGSVSFAGSMIAYGKLEGKIKDKALPFQHTINLIMLVVILGLGAFIMLQDAPDMNLFFVLMGLSLVYGVFFVLPIGGADMPVVISLLNSFTGLAAAMGGFLYNNMAMLTGGILVGSAGTILTILMCKAMNRSLLNVVIGSFGGSAKGGSGTSSESGGTYRETNPSDTAIMCAYANQVMIVPGYGLAVAQAQHTCHEFEKMLSNRGVNVIYGIHPVAGRMPGHMNVLLAEADVPYDKLIEADDANPMLANTDVVLVIGANDVVNPAAKDDPSSPIFGMPIIDAEKAKQVIVFKRSMRPGYAGIENRLFFNSNTGMLFGDAKDSLEKLISELKNM